MDVGHRSWPGDTGRHGVPGHDRALRRRRADELARLRGLARALDPDELEAVAGPARAELTAGDNTRADQLLRRALPLVDEVFQRQRAGLLHEQLARCLRSLGDPEALGQQQEAVRLVKPEPSVERARVLGSLLAGEDKAGRAGDLGLAPEVGPSP